jgi:hypothetical protein
MWRNDVFSIGLISFYLFAYCTLLQFESTIIYAMAMLLCSPLLICWMVFTVLKFGKYNGAELEGDEFGYQDKKRKSWEYFEQQRP